MQYSTWLVVLATFTATSATWNEDISKLPFGVILDYCSTVHNVSEEGMTPLCQPSNLQFPFFNRTITTISVFVSGLPFCCKVNYTVATANTLTALERDAQAQLFYEQVLTKLVARYDCPSFYPYHSCTPCLLAYRTWLCSVLFPMRCVTPLQGEVGTYKICFDVCYEVQRKCPAEFDFHCPTDENSIYGSQRSVKSSPRSRAPALQGCNSMGYAMRSAAASVSSSLALVVAMSLFCVISLY